MSTKTLSGTYAAGYALDTVNHRIDGGEPASRQGHAELGGLRKQAVATVKHRIDGGEPASRQRHAERGGL